MKIIFLPSCLSSSSRTTALLKYHPQPCFLHMSHVHYFWQLSQCPHSVINCFLSLQIILIFQREDDRANKANELSLANVGGVFVVLLAGMGLACLIAVFEFIWKSRKLATEDNVRHSQLICKGFSHTNQSQFVLSKPIDRHQTSNSCNSQLPNTTTNDVQIDYNGVSPSVIHYVLEQL
jgi:hypothetical protein